MLAMALDITTLDIIVDETTGLTDNDVDPTLAPHASDTTLQYLLSAGRSEPTSTSPSI